MVNVLFLAIEFAPYQSTGAFRTINFTKYLEEFGIRSIVITVKPDESIERFRISYNAELNKLLGKETVIHRSRIRDYAYSKNPIFSKLQQYFKIHDRYTKFWSKSVLYDLPYIISKYEPKAIITSLPFFSQGDLAVKISKKYNLPLILDMRDNWSQWCISPYSTYIHYILTLQKERKAFQKASKIITVTEELKSIFQKIHQNIKKEKFCVIPNGFDGTIDYSKSVSFDGVNNNENVIIAYVGSYYYNPRMHKDMMTPWYKKKGHKILQYSPVKENWLYRSPFFFLKTLKKLIENNPGLKSIIKFNHYGETPKWLPKMISEFGLENIFEAKGFLSYQDLKLELEKVDFFLSTALKVEGGADYAIASKTFDYIRYHKPILAFTPMGAQYNFVKESNSGLIFDPDEKVEFNANKLYQALSDGVQLELNAKFIELFHRKNQARLLAKEIKKISVNKEY